MRGGLGMKQGSGAGIEVEYCIMGGGGLQFTVPDVIIHFALAN